MTAQNVDATGTTHRHGRRRIAGLAAAIFAVALLAGCISKNQQTVQDQVNGIRQSNGLAPLVDYAPSDTKAQAWAEHLAQQGFLSHSNLADGYASGSWCGLGENVGVGQTLAAVNNAFLNSPPHRANMLGNYNRIGTGVARVGDNVYVVHEFFKSC